MVEYDQNMKQAEAKSAAFGRYDRFITSPFVQSLQLMHQLVENPRKNAGFQLEGERVGISRSDLVYLAAWDLMLAWNVHENIGGEFVLQFSVRPRFEAREKPRFITENLPTLIDQVAPSDSLETTIETVVNASRRAKDHRADISLPEKLCGIDHTILAFFERWGLAWSIIPQNMGEIVQIEVGPSVSRLDDLDRTVRWLQEAAKQPSRAYQSCAFLARFIAWYDQTAQGRSNQTAPRPNPTAPLLKWGPFQSWWQENQEALMTGPIDEALIQKLAEQADEFYAMCGSYQKRFDDQALGPMFGGWRKI